MSSVPKVPGEKVRPKAKRSLREVFHLTVPVMTVAVIVLTVFAPLTYWRYFRHLDIVADGEKWSQFGDFVSGSSGVLLAALNAWIVAYIAVKVGDFEEKSQRRQNLLDLFRHWDSEEMHRCRNKAFEIIRKHKNTTLSGFSKDHQEEAIPIWVTLSFFINLQRFIDQHIAEAEVLAQEFGHIFTWWDVMAVRTGYPVDWGDGDRWERFKATVLERHGPLAVDKWKEAAEKQREEYSIKFG